jgi:Flp pilus assembly protein TadG
MKAKISPRTAIASGRNRLGNLLRRWLHDRSGGVFATFALLSPILAGATGAAVDYGMFQRDRTRLQALVDAAAVASAREMQMAKADKGKISAVAENYVKVGEPDASVSTSVDLETFAVTVNAEHKYTAMMGALFWGSDPTVRASATAKLNGMMPLCLLALDQKAGGAVHLEQAAMMTAPNCMVYSNSKHASGVQAKDDAVVKAGLICSAGGKGRANSAKFTPEPILDCPQMDDPLRSRPTPGDTTCRYNSMVVSGGSQTLQPGVYCGGLKITDGADVTFAKGTFVIKDGPFVVNKGGSIRGTEVGFFLTGKKANLVFEAASTINIGAPKDGPMAGLLIYDDPSGAEAPAIPAYPLPIPIVGQVVGAVGGLLGGVLGGVLNLETSPREHKILSDEARTLLGTIYMPQGRLIIDASKPIADKSAYTVLVVRQIDLHAGPNLYLNSDYSASDVPVPKGVGPYGSNVMLTN